MRGDAVREPAAQDPQGLAALRPRFELRQLNTGAGEQERGVDVGPERAAVEVGQLQGIPSGQLYMAGEGGAWTVTRDDDGALLIQDGDPVRRVLAVQVGPT